MINKDCFTERKHKPVFMLKTILTITLLFFVITCGDSRDENIERINKESKLHAFMVQNHYIQVYKNNLPAYVTISKKQGANRKNIGSGFFINKKGHVLTCYHVVMGRSDIKVHPGNGAGPLDAKVYNIDKTLDLALLEVDLGEKFKVTKTIEVPAKSGPLPGAGFIAIGTPRGMDRTLITGRIAYTLRLKADPASPLNGYVQLTSSVFPGASGGPVLDLDGKLVGMMRFTLTPGGPGSAGPGFAIPANILHSFVSSQKIIKELNLVISRGIVEIPLVTPFLMTKLKLPEFNGIIIAETRPGTPAAIAGLKRYDFIMKIEGKKIKNLTEYKAVLFEHEKKENLKVEYFREGKFLTTEIKGFYTK